MRFFVKIFIFNILFYFSATLSAENLPENLPASPEPDRNKVPAFLNSNTQWADSVFNSMNLRQRIGQLFMVAAYSNKDSAHIAYISSLISNYNIGGLIFFQGGPVRQAMLTNLYQSQSKIPLLIGIDGEWGLGMRLDSTISFPRQMAWSATDNEKMIREIATAIALHCRRMGIHINFAPVADVNINRLNPVIHTRSFGDDAETTARFAGIYMDALQDNGIIATAKHFPGHGNTDGDSHFVLPTVKSSLKELNNKELSPFDYLIKHGVQGVMVAHLAVPAIDNRKNMPSSLSDSIVKYLLKEKMGFKGLVITDALNMKGVSSLYQPGETEIMAINAGNDILLYPQDIPKAIDAIEKAVKSGKIPEESINKSVFKILMAKKWVQLDHYHPVKTENLIADLNQPADGLAKRIMIEKSITLIKNTNHVIPVKDLSLKRIANVMIGAKNINDFYLQSQFYAESSPYIIPYQFNTAFRDSMQKILTTYNLIIFSFHGLNLKTGQAYGFSPELLTLIDSLKHKRQLILAFFGNPYPLLFFDSDDEIESVVVAYDDMPQTQNQVAQFVYGAANAGGKLPVTIGSLPKGQGITDTPVSRLKYTIPEELDMDARAFLEVDSVVNDAISKKVMPGCQVLFAIDGKIIFNKAYGFHTYDSIEPVNPQDLYDIASVTKTAATTLAVMKLYEKDEIDLNEKVSFYLPQFSLKNKAKIKVIDLLTHQAGLKPWIPFYKIFCTGSRSDSTYCRNHLESGFSVEITDSLYLLTSFRDTIFDIICNSEIKNYGKYLYSDLGFILLQRIIENKTGMPLDDYVTETFYKPMGLQHTLFHPLVKFEKRQIAPTTIDTIFRHDTVWGNVHDPTAALMDGVSGHAGVFSNASDLACIMQMLLWKGSYGGEEYLKPGTIDHFTRAPFQKKGNRRGIGFDKPEPKAKKVSPVCSLSSLKSYGHTGFTGNMVWADPDNNSIFIFLSNRTFPDENNYKLVEMNVRTKIQEIFLKACKK